MTDRVTVAVVAFNDEASLDRCVRSLRMALDAPIVLVDNHSEDGTWALAQALGSELPGVTAFRTEHNAGYASAANVARSMVDTEFLAVTNADSVSTGDWVSPIIDHLDEHPTVAAASPTLGLTDHAALNAEGLDIHKTGFGFNRHLGRDLGAASTVPTRVPGIQGTAFVVRLDALDDIGGWYAGGFLYHEDVELSWALRLAGNEISHVPTPPVMHDYELTMSPEKFFLLERNRLEMLSADLGTASKIVLAPVILATELAVWLYAIRKGKDLVSSKLRSYRSFTERRPIRRQRSIQVAGFRRVSDGALLRSMSWRYPRSQTKALHRGTTSSGRRGDRELPTS
ncbi:MAG: glycosyltransferase family 2 protein [Acidimicrobiia bacterium]|nr:MAG: glycosyltransferase family 2 protein [Acidimicrobiia bacterium]